MVARALEEVLAVWREAERVVAALPEDSRERREIEFEVGRLRRLYGRLTDRTVPPSEQHISAALEAVEQVRRRIVQIHGPISTPGGRPSAQAQLVSEPSLEG